LASAAIPLVNLTMRREQESELRAALREIRNAIDTYKQAAADGHVEQAADAIGYPPNLQVLVDGVEDQRDPNKTRIYFLRRVPRDPLYPDSTAAAADSWGLRSYESPPDDPQPGDTVYDVYSLAPGKGLNGVPYREW